MFSLKCIFPRTKIIVNWKYLLESPPVRRYADAKSCEPVSKPVTPSSKSEKKTPIMKKFRIYRFNPQGFPAKPSMQEYTVDISECGAMVLDALNKIKTEQDSTLTYRRSCREGVCGSCAINVDGANGLACLMKINPKGASRIYPLPHMYVIRDLVVDFEKFTSQHDRIRPYLLRRCGDQVGQAQYLQSMKDRDHLDGHIECILCACCSTSCPEYWWHGHSKPPNDFLGPAALLNAVRWLRDSRDVAFEERLSILRNYFAVYRCHGIYNCTTVCPKGLNPAKAISELRSYLSGAKKKIYPEMTGTAAPLNESACPPPEQKKQC